LRCLHTRRNRSGHFWRGCGGGSGLRNLWGARRRNGAFGTASGRGGFLCHTHSARRGHAGRSHDLAGRSSESLRHCHHVAHKAVGLVAIHRARTDEQITKATGKVSECTATSTGSGHKHVAQVFTNGTRGRRQGNLRTAFAVERHRSRQIDYAFAADKATSGPACCLEHFAAVLLAERRRAFCGRSARLGDGVTNRHAVHDPANDRLVVGRIFRAHERILRDWPSGLNVDAFLAGWLHLDDATTAFNRHDDVLALRSNALQQGSGITSSRRRGRFRSSSGSGRSGRRSTNALKKLLG
jgi:hypothetical protein